MSKSNEIEIRKFFNYSTNNYNICKFYEIKLMQFLKKRIYSYLTIIKQRKHQNNINTGLRALMNKEDSL
jgi:hypothetical protein